MADYVKSICNASDNFFNFFAQVVHIAVVVQCDVCAEVGPVVIELRSYPRRHFLRCKVAARRYRCDALAEQAQNHYHAVKLEVPLTVEVHSGNNWYDAK